MPAILRGKCSKSPNGKHQESARGLTKQKKGIYYYAPFCTYCGKRMRRWRKV